jgi:hypothetical protein
MLKNKSQNVVKAMTLIFVIVLACSMIGCTTGGEGRESADRTGTPVLSEPNELQTHLNRMPTVTIAGNAIQLMFGGNSWIGQQNGVDFLGGSIEMVEETETSGRVTIRQTHIYVERTIAGRTVGTWVRSPAPAITLVYSLEPPSLRIR